MNEEQYKILKNLVQLRNKVGELRDNEDKQANKYFREDNNKEYEKYVHSWAILKTIVNELSDIIFKGISEDEKK